MAAEVETMAYRYLDERDVPWHGLGTPVDHAMTAEEAIRLAGLDWDVTPSPIMTDGVIIPGYTANVRSSDNKVLGVVSKKYQIVQNQEAFGFVNQILQSGDVKFETAGSLCGGKQVWITAHLPPENILGDEVVPYLVFTNSHDGKNSGTVATTPIRTVCKNTLTAALNNARRTWTFRHMGNLESKVLEAQIALDLTHKYMNGLRRFAETMVAKKISRQKLEAIINQVFPLDEEASDRIKNNVILMRDSFKEIYKNTPDTQNFNGTAWGIFNSFADMATHIQPLRKTENFQEKRFSSFIDGNKLLLSAQEALMAA